MNRLLVVAVCSCLSLTALAGNKSSTSTVAQNVREQSWTQKCTVKKVGVSALNSYSGLLWIRYNDPYGEEEFVRRTWSVGPGATTFTETSTGLYSITAKLTTVAPITISVTFSATRYGPLTPKYNGSTGALIGYGGTFTCMGSIVVGNDMSGALVHSLFDEAHVGEWQ